MQKLYIAVVFISFSVIPLTSGFKTLYAQETAEGEPDFQGTPVFISAQNTLYAIHLYCRTKALLAPRLQHLDQT